MVGEPTMMSVLVTETGTEVDPPAESDDALGTGTEETEGAGHVTETGRGGVAHEIETVGEADHVIGIVGTRGGVTDRGLARGNVVGEANLSQTRRERGRRRGREREGTTRVEGERGRYGGMWRLEDLNTFHHCSTRPCKVHTQ